MFLQPDDRTGQRAGLSGMLHDHFDFFAAGLLHDLAQARVVGQVDGETLQGFLDGVMAVVADGRNVAAAAILEHHALQEVVDVLNGEGEVDAGVAVHLTLALKVADAAGEEDHLRDRQLRARLDRRRIGDGRVALFCGRERRLQDDKNSRGHDRRSGQHGQQIPTTHGSFPPGARLSNRLFGMVN